MLIGLSEVPDIVVPPLKFSIILIRSRAPTFRIAAQSEKCCSHGDESARYEAPPSLDGTCEDVENEKEIRADAYHCQDVGVHEFGKEANSYQPVARVFFSVQP